MLKLFRLLPMMFSLLILVNYLHDANNHSLALLWQQVQAVRVSIGTFLLEPACFNQVENLVRV